MGIKAIVLAAGKGTRMKSDILKVLHHVAGKSVLNYVLDAILSLDVDEVYVVVGHKSEQVKSHINHPKVTFVEQIEQLGTGHAVMQVEPFLRGETKSSTMMVLAGDCPLVEKSTLTNLLATHKESNAAGTILTAELTDPGSYGRIVRGKMGTVLGIKEAKDCVPKELAIREINAGIYAFDERLLFESLKKVTTDNVQKEYYLTDVIQLLKGSGEAISAYCAEDADEVLGINTRMDLAKINQIVYQKNNLHFMEYGVTLIDPSSTFIDSTVTIGTDTIISPFTVIEGMTVIGPRCKIGPHSYLKNVVIDPDTIVPPFSHQEAMYVSTAGR
jgi:bifunctional UDP-N-acetylglucosamine pyrophosphorylase/glucosamine-1-phosphate N-acetyltransferase